MYIFTTLNTAKTKLKHNQLLDKRYKNNNIKCAKIVDISTKI